jgi:hypothetical protein
MAQISGEHWAMENINKHFEERRNDSTPTSALPGPRRRSRGSSGICSGLIWTRGSIEESLPPITATSLWEYVRRRTDKGFIAYGLMMGDNPLKPLSLWLFSLTKELIYLI